MANSSGKYGFVPIEGAQCVHEYDIDPSTDLHYPNDVVDLVADQGIGVHTAGNAAIAGVIAGIKDSDGNPVANYPGGSVTGYKALVYDGRDQRYKVKATTALTAEAVGEYADLVAGTPTTISNTSGQYLVTFSDSAAAFQVTGLAQSHGNDWGANQDVIVGIVEQKLWKAGS